MKEYVVEIPFAGYVSVTVKAQNKDRAIENALEIANDCEFQADKFCQEDIQIKLVDYQPSLDEFAGINKTTVKVAKND